MRNLARGFLLCLIAIGACGVCLVGTHSKTDAASAQPVDASPSGTTPKAEAISDKKKRSPKPAKKRPASTGQISAAQDARFEECKEKLKAAQTLGLLYDLTWDPPREPRVVIGATFYPLPFDGKQGFARTLNCFLMAGATDKYISFDVLDWRSGNPVGRYEWDKLSIRQ